MKLLIRYFLPAILIVAFIGCKGPEPTALVEDKDPIEIEVLTPNITEPTIFGIDSTGLSQNPSRFTNLITVVGAKVLVKGLTLKSSFAQAVFFDKTKPVYGFHGRLLGYTTLTPGNIFFNNQKAQLRPLTIKYAVNKDTSLGPRYVLHRRGILGDPFEYDFNSKINFRFEPVSSSVISFDIPTPPEISLNYRLTGSRASKNLNLFLEWNAGYIKNFEILINIVDDQRNIDFPLYKIKTADDGKFVIPKRLLEELAVKFDKITFTLIRKYENRQSEGMGELIVISQSITSISVDIP